MGASHPQTNYLIFSGAGTDVSILVDDDTEKAGHFAHTPKPTRILTTAEFLREEFPCGVLFTAFAHELWMKMFMKNGETKRVGLLPYTRKRHTEPSIG